jgi:hypothetical protein
VLRSGLLLDRALLGLLSNGLRPTISLWRLEATGHEANPSSQKIGGLAIARPRSREIRSAQGLSLGKVATIRPLVPVDGENLKVPAPLETALNYAKQIADALESAHGLPQCEAAEGRAVNERLDESEIDAAGCERR